MNELEQLRVSFQVVIDELARRWRHWESAIRPLAQAHRAAQRRMHTEYRRRTRHRNRRTR